MSMISTQIDELRKLARAFPDTSPRAALLRDAADTIWQLRDDLQRANAENAKLREERDYYKALWEHATVTDCELRRVRAAWKEDRKQNAKLRELVRDMFACISHANEADWFYFERDKLGCGMRCVVNGEGCGLPVLADRMRELGVGVDG